MKKIYVKLVLIYLFIFLLGNAASFAIASLSVEKSLSEQLDDSLTSLASNAKYLYEKGSTSIEDIEKINIMGLIAVRFFKNWSELTGEYQMTAPSPPVNDKPIIVEAKRRSSHNLKLPLCIVKSGNYYIAAVPEANRMLRSFRYIILRANILALIFGSILLLIASGFIVKPVKGLSEATKKIASGDFNVHIERTSKDEIGQLIDNFNTMTKELAGMELLRNDFVSNISHEFKTPLMSIEGYTKLLRDCESETERNEYIKIIMEETKRLSDLSSGILLLNRIENGNITLVRTPIRLDEQIRQVILSHERKWTSKDIDLQLDLDEITYEGYEQLLYQVWLNLLDNAVKFSKHGGVVEISLRKADEKIIFMITDYGKGMSDEEKKRMFEKFFTGDKSRNTEGNGLGLSIVKRAIDLHKGQIVVTSRLGEFTSIKVIL